MILENFHPFELSSDKKKTHLLPILQDLTEYHYNNCPKYKEILVNIYGGIDVYKNMYDLPFIPVRMFKLFDLLSVSKENISRTMTSSGTSGQQVSKIYLDKDTAKNQAQALSKIVTDFTSRSRGPMIILDTPSVLSNKQNFSARGAGILGFSMFGSRKMFAFDEHMKLDLSGVECFLENNSSRNLLLFGFTYIVYQKFIQALRDSSASLDLSGGVLIHGGGWKKMSNYAIGPHEFKAEIEKFTKITRVHDYYGMVEQTGAVHMECECGHLHVPIYADVIIRDPSSLKVQKIGDQGQIQVISALAKSYPGHSLLTEDIGVILGEDNCQCGRKGKYFQVIGRMSTAEVRGCSDTYS